MADVYVYGFKPIPAALPTDLIGDHVIDAIVRCLNYGGAYPAGNHYWQVDATQATASPVGTLYSGLVVRNPSTGHRISFVSGVRIINKTTVYCQLHPEIPSDATGINPADGNVVGGTYDGLPNPYASPSSSIHGNVFRSSNYYGLNGSGVSTANSYNTPGGAMTVTEYSYLVELEDALMLLTRRHLTSGTNNLSHGGLLAGSIIRADNESDASIGIDGTAIVSGIWSASTSSNYYSLGYNDTFSWGDPTTWIRVGSQTWNSMTLSNSALYSLGTGTYVLYTNTNVSLLSLGPPLPAAPRLVPFAVRARPDVNLGAQVGQLKYIRQVPNAINESTIVSGTSKYDTGISPNSISWIHYCSSYGSGQANSLNVVFPWSFGGPVAVDP
jgi:hypothetical protein